MKRFFILPTLISIITFLCLPISAYSSWTQGNDVRHIDAEGDLIPQQIEWEGTVYNLAPWKDEHKGIRYGDFDGDGVDEIIASFRCSPEGTEYPQPFHLIYDVIDGKPKLVKTIVPDNNYLGEIRIIDLEKGGKKEIAIFTHGGTHYTSLLIYKYEQDEYKCIFEDGSACGVELMDKMLIPSIKIGRANWDSKVKLEDGTEINWSYSAEPLWEIHMWENGEFIYKPDLSSSKRLSEGEEFKRYFNEAAERLKEIEGKKGKGLIEKTEKELEIEKEVVEFARQHKDYEQYRPLMYEISLRPENENLSLQELYDKAKEEDEILTNEFLDMLNINLYFKGYSTTYGDWTPLITEIDGEPVVYHDSNLFLMAYERELEKKYGVELDGNNILLKDFDEYFAKRAEKEGHDILVTTLIEDFYVERGLLHR